MSVQPFSVFKRKSSKFYYVKFKTKDGEYSTPVSTKRPTKEAAIKTAWEWYINGKPTKEGIVPLSLEQTLKKVTKEDVVYICENLKKRGWLRYYILDENKDSIDFVKYLTEFWNYDTSPYIKEKRRKKHSIHRRYCINMSQIISLYWIPYFSGRILGEIKKQDIESFIDDIIADLPLSASRKNQIIQAISRPLKWAYNKEYISKDITSGILLFSGKSKERQILTPEIAGEIFKKIWYDERAKLANMLASVTGLRAGEIQALRVQDIGEDCLYINHTYNDYDGMKIPKNKESRIVQLPFPDIIRNLLYLASQNPHGTSPDSFVFWSEKSASKPIKAHQFLRDLRYALLKAGLSKESAYSYLHLICTGK